MITIEQTLEFLKEYLQRVKNQIGFVLLSLVEDVVYVKDSAFKIQNTIVNVEKQTLDFELIIDKATYNVRLKYELGSDGEIEFCELIDFTILVSSEIEIINASMLRTVLKYVDSSFTETVS